MKPLLGIGWQISELHGWGVFGINLARQLLLRGAPRPVLLHDPVLDGAAIAELKPLIDEWQMLKPRLAALKNTEILHAPEALIMHGFGNHFTGPGSQPKVWGGKNVGFIFFEEVAFTEAELALGRRLDLMLAGSTWNARLLRRFGFENALCVMQGVDLQRFAGLGGKRRYQDRFVVFSGGKLEYRKAQDIVLVAFKEFQRRHPDALLLTAWHNPWPQTAASVAEGPHGTGAPRIDPASGQLDLAGWARDFGIPEGAFVDGGFRNNRELPALYAEADVALFPNRAEGGTNLVAMELMASGVPCILSANTGHIDLIDVENCYVLHEQALSKLPERDGWGESDPAEIVERLEKTYADREQARRIGAAGRQFISGCSWQNQVSRLIEILSDVG